MNQINHQNMRSVSAFGNEKWLTPRQQYSMKKNINRTGGSVNQLP
jgi:hypothetical protein